MARGFDGGKEIARTVEQIAGALRAAYPTVAPKVSRVRSAPIVVTGGTGILGREVATLVNEQLQPGIYEIEWDAGNYPSGIYFYTLSIQDFSKTRKAVLIK